MKEGVIDVLMYIFSSYADQDENLPEDRDGIDADLRAAGFESVEMVINRVMALDADTEVDIDELKWIVMMVLFNSAEEQDENALMHYEDIVFADQPAVFH